MSATIELTDIGPVEQLSIPVPDDGGVVVLRGANGTGKSSTLKAVERLATGKKDIALTARDGVQRGEMSGCGVTLRVAKSITRTGELECESLEGRLSVADLVDPGLKGADEADAKRIRSLVQLAGVSPDVKIFHQLFDDGITFDEVTKGKNLDTDDILVLADRIKRAIDEAARTAEGQANVEKSKAAACKESASGINRNVETDDDKLQKLLEEAIRHEQMLATKLGNSIQRNHQIEDAKRKIGEAKELAGGISLEEATKRFDEARDSVMIADGAIEQKRKESESIILKLREEMKELESASKLADMKFDAASRELESAKRFEETIQSMQSIAAEGSITGPTNEEIEAAQDAVANCRASIEAGVLARRAEEQLVKANGHAAKEAA